ncbi:hypothetical protein NLJ89_g5754 [Agrocybe chaxingu]|uniref:F-box domain-containing protein n=1 Tax=Agrocybe chaxingu TaxID=84603 RepID=A0A9W8K6T6_9AGAR|nr:hypothetical protein NLJ89_g5754 [Agrocybe chaxingu]
MWPSSSPCAGCGRLSQVDSIGRPLPPCPLGDDARCSPCVDLIALEEKIHKAKKVLDGLIEEHRALRSEVNEIHDPLFKKLPPELVSRVFLACLPENKNNLRKAGNLDSLVLPIRQSSAPLLLASICKRWRQLALATPQLWSSILVQLRPENVPYQTKVVEQWLSRSGCVPLSLHIFYSEWRPGSVHATSIDSFIPIIDLLNQHSDRWQDLVLALPHPLISRLGRSSQAATRLNTVRVALHRNAPVGTHLFPVSDVLPAPAVVDIMGLPFSSVNISWRLVTSVKFGWINVAECLALFQQAPQMTSCAIEFLEEAPSDFVTLPQHIVHWHLHSLTIDTSSPASMGPLFYSLILPSLKELVYGPYGRLESLHSLVSRSSCPLTKLNLTLNGACNWTNLADFLHQTPMLESLSFGTIRLNDDLLHLFASAPTTDTQDDLSGDIFLPHLQELAIQCRRDFSWASIPKLFPRRPLKSLSLDISGDYDAVIDDKESANHILDLVDGGVNIAIKGISHDLIREARRHYARPTVLSSLEGSLDGFGER